MYCPNCGAKAEENKFCSQCGSSLGPERLDDEKLGTELPSSKNLVVVDPSQPLSGGPIKKSRAPFVATLLVLLLAGGAGAGWYFLPGLNAEPTINFENASGLTMRPLDFGFDIGPRSEPTKLLDRDAAFLGADDCVEQDAIMRALRGVRVRAEKYYVSDDGNNQFYSFEQQFLSFSDPADVQDIVAEVGSGVMNSRCSFEGDIINVRHYGLSSAEEEFGFGGEDSVFFLTDTEVFSEYLTFDGREITVLIPQGSDLLVVSGLVEIPGNSVSYSEMFEAVGIAIERAFGVEDVE